MPSSHQVEDDRAAAASILALSGHWSAPAPAPGAPAAASESMSETLKRQLSRLVRSLRARSHAYLTALHQSSLPFLFS